MQTTPNDSLPVVKEFNRNIDWLRKNKESIESSNNAPDLLYKDQAAKLLNRSENWLEKRMIKQKDCFQPMNMNGYLIEGIDWTKEGKFVVIKHESVLMLKSSMLGALLN